MTIEELRNKMATLNKEYNRIKNILADKDFHLNGNHVFYGKTPFSVYCGTMDKYNEFINDVEYYAAKYQRGKNESLGKLS